MSARIPALTVVRLAVAFLALGAAWIWVSGALRAQPKDVDGKPAETETKEKTADDGMAGSDNATKTESDKARAGTEKTTDASNTPRSSGLYGPIVNTALRRFLVLMTAFLIGVSGSGAFHLGVYTGFIARESRASLLEFLHSKTDAPWYIRWWFWYFGGAVAVVFQMADADVLVPIQAFVLGASWPSVVTQLMSGRSGPSPASPTTVSPQPPPQPPAGGAPPPIEVNP